MTTFAAPESDREHPVIAWIAVAAIVCASVLIAWARVEVHGTRDLEAALYACEQTAERSSSPGDAAAQDARIDDAVAASRWASAF